MNSLPHKQQTTLVLKHIIRDIIIEYSLDTHIYNKNILSQHLLTLILKVTLEFDTYTPALAINFLNFLENNLIRGAIFPNTFRSLLLELIELLEGISKAKSTINISGIFQ